MHKLIFGAVLAICLSTNTLPAQNPTLSPKITQEILEQAATKIRTNPEHLNALLRSGKVSIEKDMNQNGYVLRGTGGGGLLIVVFEDQL